MQCSKTLNSTKRSWLQHIEQLAVNRANVINVNIEVDQYILADVIDKWCQEVAKVEAVEKVNLVSQYRISGFLTFWIRKLKPFNIKEYNGNIQTRLYINELLSMIIGLILLTGSLTHNNKQISAGAFHRLLTSLRYNSMSPFSVALVYEYLYE